MFDAEKTGLELKRLRRQAGLTQSELGEKLMVSCQAVSNWERGISPPDIDNLIALSEFFGVKVDALINPTIEECYIAVDGGGTKTEMILFTRAGEVLNRIVLASSNPNDIGLENCRELLLSGIRKLALKSGEPQAIFLGVSGIGIQSAISQSTSEFIKEKTGVKKVVVTSDTRNLFALDSKADIIAICGTGVVVMARNMDLWLGGWGYMLDQAGSGYDVGAHALNASFGYEEGIEEHTLIYDLVCEKMGVKQVKEIIYEVYEKGKRFVASFAPIVIEAYKRGDKKAGEILEFNMERLAKLITRAVEVSGKNNVLLSGGFIDKNRETLLPILRKFVTDKAELIFSDCPPVYGACKECLKLAGVTRETDFRENFLKTYQLFKN